MIFMGKNQNKEEMESMNDRTLLKMLLVLVFAFAAVAFAIPDAEAYQYFAADTDGGTLTNCEACHAEIADRGAEHNTHDDAAEGDCTSCHMNGLANRDAPPLENCVRCHGRSEDAGNDAISPGIGAGLRQHHEAVGVADCFTAGCHTDNAASYTPVGEHILPTYYATGINPLNLAPCDGSEEFFPSNSISLDNDGDGLTDLADPDCIPNDPPVADPNGPYTANAGEVITFDGSGSSDPDGTIVSYDWDFGDGMQRILTRLTESTWYP
jgi:hypothetical protein